MFPEAERITPELLRGLAESYNPQTIHRAAVVLPEGGPSHWTGEFAKTTAGDVDGVEFDGYFLWALVRERGGRLTQAVEDGLGNRSIRWWPDGLDQVTLCFDACHSAVAYEEPEQALAALDEAGIRVGKAQLSAALTVPAAAHDELRAFADPIYLHQVTERGSLRTWPDLPEAL